jgi:AcrR family transcriptional regulator
MTSDTPRLRADARRNVEGIRLAALDVFRAHGLNSPLDEVARAAGVSKGTIYHRFGGRQGLIDSVVEELVAERINGIITAVRTIEEPVERFESYLRQIWLLQYDEPAANDVLLRAQPGSDPLNALCEHASAAAGTFLADAQASPRTTSTCSSGSGGSSPAPVSSSPATATAAASSTPSVACAATRSRAGPGS